MNQQVVSLPQTRTRVPGREILVCWMSQTRFFFLDSTFASSCTFALSFSCFCPTHIPTLHEAFVASGKKLGNIKLLWSEDSV